MKKLMFCIFVLFLVSGFSSTTIMASTNNVVTLDGGKIVNNRTLVPLRSIFEELGASVQWDQKTKTITATKGNTTIWLKIGSKNTEVNGKTVTIDVPAQIHNGSTLVPLRFISESMGASIEWNANDQTAVIDLSNKTIIVNVRTWNYYGNARFGFMIKYPSNWKIGEEPTNGDGVALYSDSKNEVLAYASFFFPEFANDHTHAKKVQIADGHVVFVNVSKVDGKVIYTMDVVVDDIQYELYASVTNDFYEKNKDILDEMVNDFQLIDGIYH